MLKQRYCHTGAPVGVLRSRDDSEDVCQDANLRFRHSLERFVICAEFELITRKRLRQWQHAEGQ